MRVSIAAWIWVGLAGVAFGGAVEDFITAAKEQHGEIGERAAKYLADHMPERDRDALDADFLITNLDLAFQARKEFPWASAVPEEQFFNDVLPYAVFDETREAWRADLLARARPLVKEATSASEAAQELNRRLFAITQVHYHTGRQRANQSPSESIASGKATCTGLSILLVNACRAVGIPARAVGTPLWSNGRGNHTWVEVWDGGWHFTGADEYDAKGLNHGWFTADAAAAKVGDPLHAIFATTWKRADLAFPMIWSPQDRSVAAVDVTTRYSTGEPTDSTVARLGVRLFQSPGGERLHAAVAVFDASGKQLDESRTQAGTADLNDMPRFHLPAGSSGRLRFTREGESRDLPFGPLKAGDPTVDAVWSSLQLISNTPDAPARGLTKDEAARTLRDEVAKQLARTAEDGKAALEEKSITLDGKTLRWDDRVFGEAPEGGRSLWISMHGGGNTLPRVNDQQWRNQIGLYQPKEGIYLAPRAPTDTWNLWHEEHIDPLFQKLIELHVASRGVNPDKIYLMGYSAGGDGVWELAPRMADRFAAAAMMAGHPNASSVLGLRNLPFAIFMGGEDAAYDRNKVAAEKTRELEQLAEEDPGGYVHFSRIYEGLPHWMDGKDAEALPWMEKFARNPWPRRIVWLQGHVLHDRFYWLKIPDKTAAKTGAKIIAEVKEQTIQLDGDVPAKTEIRLSDSLLNLDQPVTIVVNGKKVFEEIIPRTASAIQKTLAERLDAPAAASAIWELP